MQMVSLSSISCKHVARYVYLALHCTKIAQISLTLFLVDVCRERFECTVIGSIEGSQPVSIISNQIMAVLRTHNFSVPCIRNGDQFRYNTSVNVHTCIRAMSHHSASINFEYLTITIDCFSY